MENKVTFTTAEALILLGGIATAWESINDAPEGYDPVLDEKAKVIVEAEFNEDGSLKNEELNSELEKNVTFANLLHKVIDIYNGGI